MIVLTVQDLETREGRKELLSGYEGGMILVMLWWELGSTCLRLTGMAFEMLGLEWV